MLRARFTVPAVLAMTAVLAGFQARTPADAYRPSEVPDRIIVNWTDDAATGFSVTWRTATAVTAGFAEIAQPGENQQFAKDARRVEAVTQTYQTNLGAANGHSVTFTGLTPSTAYAYRVGDGSNWSEWATLRTASQLAEPFSFIYLGDAQNGILPYWSRLIRQAYAHAPDARFIVHAGDLINRSTLDEEWGEWHRGGGWVNQVVPSVPSPGNHEYGRLTENGPRVLTSNWRPQFTLPLNGVAGVEETNYYTDIHNLRMIVLNTNEKQKEQAEWLEKVLSGNPKAWTVVTFHHPIYSTAVKRDNKELREVLQPIFDRYRVDLVLNGHDHVYGRTGLVGGTVYVVSVAGIKFYAKDRKPEFARVGEDTQLFQIIKVNGNRLRYESRMAGGGLYDAFELVKRRGRVNRMVNRIPATPERLRPPAAEPTE
jgi:3',5'-cyclic AMP phosphodiesterase CpdA